MYTLRTAAKATGISRATIHRYIQSGKISARRKHDGFYEIDPAELHRVFAPVSTTSSQDGARQGDNSADASAQNSLAMQNARLEAELAGLKELLYVHKSQVDDLRTERDRLIGTVEGAHRLLTYERAKAAEQKAAEARTAAEARAAEPKKLEPKKTGWHWLWRTA
jgi:hypothetical protein